MIKNASKIINKISILIFNLSNQIRKYNFKVVKDNEYGCEAFLVRNLENEILLWVGMWFELWEEEECGLVCLISKLHSETSFRNFDLAFEGFKTYKRADVKWKYFSLDFMLSEDTDVTEKVVSFLVERLNLLNNKSKNNIS